MVPSSPSVIRPETEPADRRLDTLAEYMTPEDGSNLPRSEGVAASAHSAQRPSEGEKLTHEWEIDEPSSGDLPSEDDIQSRLDRIESRLDAFETTCYTFLLYAKQLTDRTASFFEDIFGLSSDDLAQIHDRLGVNYNNKGDYASAIGAFRKLVELRRTPDACYKLGVAYDNNGDFQESVESYRAAIALDASYLKAYYKLAEVYGRTENYGEAVRCLKEAVEIDPGNAETHYRLGSIHSARGSHDEAVGAFNEVLKLDPEHPGIYQSLGLAYEQKGEHNRAIEFFKKSI
jgi:tetratricopeptide (TPR) repeat protein